MCDLKKAPHMPMCRTTFVHDCSLLRSAECNENHHIEQLHSSSNIKMYHEFLE